MKWTLIWRVRTLSLLRNRKWWSVVSSGQRVKVEMSVRTITPQHSASKFSAWLITNDCFICASTESPTDYLLLLFSLSEERFPNAGLGINASSFTPTVNTMPNAQSLTVLSLMSAAEEPLLLHTNQVFLSHCTIIRHFYNSRCVWIDTFHLSNNNIFAAVQPPPTASVCRFFPDCKKVDCPFYHPKVRKFEMQSWSFVLILIWLNFWYLPIID